MRKLRVIRDDSGLITDYQTEGEFPKFGNNDNRVDHFAVWLVSTFMNKLRKYPTYRNALIPSRSSQSLQMWYMERAQEILLTEDGLVNHSPREPIPCQGATLMAYMHQQHRWPRSPTAMPQMAYP